MKILLSAAEASSDAHGAELLRALRQESPGLDAFGIGGPKLQAEGLRAVADARDLLAMGSSEVLGRLPRILKALGAVAQAAETEKPDVAVVIDYPEFHFRLATRLARLGIPIVYYIPPKVWVWRRGRIRRLRELFARVLCVLPFEEEFYRGEGVPVRYVGNPLLDELPWEMSRAEARQALALGAEELVLAVLPGSRPSELARHVPLMIGAARKVASRLSSEGRLKAGQKLRVLVPLAATEDPGEVEKLAREVDEGNALVDLRVSQGDSARVLVAADAGLIKSGTSTLEAGVLGCPHAVVYRTGWMTSFLFRRVVRYRGPVGLVNLVGSWKPGVSSTSAATPRIAREILLEDVTEESLSQEAYRLLTDSAAQARMREEFEGLRLKLRGAGRSPSRDAAREVLAVAGARAGAEANA